MSVLTTIKDDAPEPTVNFPINVTNATVMDILPYSAELTIPCPQMQQHELVTPVNSTQLEQLLQGHPNRELVQHVIRGF